MCYLTTVAGSFHGRVLAARLGTEGVLVMLKGTTDGPYPLPSAVDVLVPADQLKLAREILLADAVDDAFGEIELAEACEDESGEVVTRFEGLAWESDGSLTALPAADASDAFSSSLDAHRSRRSPRRLPALYAGLVVLLVATMVVVAFAAAAAH
jgi:hypothetical protein